MTGPETSHSLVTADDGKIDCRHSANNLAEIDFPIGLDSAVEPRQGGEDP
jgi:hypothetical protein